ncbi:MULTISPECIES: amino acid ABC transporter permease [unclassified Variovorax]|uniref:amino acid ABC transporter permease n=1 Tax=unclassified Variovorax TaxID=663243 RepID=UPI0032E63F60
MNHFDFSVIAQAWPFLFDGLVFSLKLTAVGFLGGLLLGIGLALVRHLEVPVASQLASAYITLIRSVPLIMVLFWFFFLMPLVLMWMTGASRPVQIGPVWTAFVTFTLFEAAYYAEIIHAGFKSMAKGQYGACKALGMSTWQTYRLIILPQVLRVVSPILLTQTIILFQDTSLVYVLSVTDLLGAASKIAQRDGRLVEMYLAVAVIYMVLSSLTSQLVAILKNRDAVPGRR